MHAKCPLNVYRHWNIGRLAEGAVNTPTSHWEGRVYSGWTIRTVVVNSPQYYMEQCMLVSKYDNYVSYYVT